MFKTASLLALSLVVFGCTETRRDAPTNGASSSDALAPPSLQQAHDAYLAGDYLLTARHIKSTLLDPTSTDVAKENAYELLDATYVATNGKIPSGYKLPTAVKHVVFGVQHGESKFGPYRSVHLWARVPMDFASKVTELRVDRADGTTLMKNGMPNTTFEVKGENKDEVALRLNGVDAPLPDGVYSIHISMNAAPIVDTYVIARHLESSAAPTVTSPGAVITEGAPTVKFAPFHSPEFADYEARSINFYVEEKDTHTVRWTKWTGSPDDLNGTATGEPLKSGSYWLAVSASERRSFGPIELDRSSQTGIPFDVVR